MWFGALLLVMGGITFIVWGFDKYRAKTHQWRVPERWLYSLTLLGGSFGALAGMLFFRHKTRKTNFWVVVFVSMAVHSYLLLDLLR